MIGARRTLVSVVVGEEDPFDLDDAQFSQGVGDGAITAEAIRARIDSSDVRLRR